jgi:hypothetical protein
MRRRGQPIYQAQTGMLALLILSTIGLLFATVKVYYGDVYMQAQTRSGSFPHLDNSIYAFGYVMIAMLALAILAATSLSTGVGLGSSGRRFAHRLMAVTGLVWSWLLLGAIAAPTALRCSRGIVPDPFTWGSSSSFVGTPGVWYYGPVFGEHGIGYRPQTGAYVNLCSVATQHAAQWATGLLPLALALTVLPAIAGFVVVRVARTPTLTPVHA